ncbi:MAG TPA: sensor histidine kinase [Symbiobacteriaceae bacterium]|nr:sensor histidine kinase [Symbiobacteriaceae bacterium]
MRWPRLTLRRKIIGLASGLVFLSVLAGGALLIHSVGTALENELGQRALSVARTVAQVDQVRQELETPSGPGVLQPTAERMRIATGVAYVVILDMGRVRLSHPLEEKVGTRFEGGDEGPAFAEQTYVSRARGVNGRSVRAFVPIMSLDGRIQVGVVTVGILVPGIPALLVTHRTELLLALISALTVGVSGAWLLAAHIKRQLNDMEPTEIARLLEERTAAFASITEGLIAIDSANRITLINAEARRVLELPDDMDVRGRNVLEVVPYSRLPDVIRTGQGARNQQMLYGKTIILTNRLPIYVKGRIVGALATFRDRTEFNTLAEELTGVTQFVDALRAQNHEWLNKLHTIAGMVQLKKYSQAIDFIFSTTEQQQELTRFLARSIKDYRVSGLLLGKVTRARERGITLEIDRASRLDVLPPLLEANDLVVVLGNLLENAMDAVAGLDERVGRIRCLFRGGADGVEIRVEDNGTGLPPSVPVEKLFEQGFSTKGAPNRGIGLALVRQIVDLGRGRISVESAPGRTVFHIQLPGGGANAADSGTGSGRRSHGAASES